MDSAVSTSDCTRYTQLFASMAQGVVYQDEQGRIISANPAAERALGLSFEQMAGRAAADPGWNAVREDGCDFPGAEHPAMVALRTGQPVGGVVMGIVESGGEAHRWLLVHATPNFRAGENRPFEVFTTFTDITERKREEDALRKAWRELEAKHVLLQQVVDSQPQHLFWKDRSGAFRGCNRAGAQAIGLDSPEDIAGKTDYDLYANRTDGDFFFGQDLGVMEGGVSHYHTLSQKQESTGEIKWLDVSKVPLRDAQGNVDGLLVSYEDVTDLSRVEESLRKFKQVVEQSPDAIIIADLDGNIEYVNPAFCRTYGYGAPEVQGRNPRLLKSGHTTPDQYRAMWNRIRAGQTWQGEFLNRKSDGGLIWQSAVFSPIFSETGVITHFLSIQEDISALKQHEIELQAAKDYAENLIATANAMVVGLDRQGQIQIFNEAAEKITGYGRAEVLNRSWFDTVAPRERFPAVWQEFERLLAGGLPQDFESPILSKSGEERYIVWQNNHLSESGRIIGTLSFGIDITERMQAEASLRESEKRFRVIADYTYNWESWIDPAGRLLWVNPAVERIAGYTPDECYAMPDYPFPLIHPDDRASIAPYYAQAVAGESGNDLEFRAVRKDGGEFQAAVSWQAACDGEGRFVGHRSSIRDITLQTQIRTDLFNAKQMAQLVLDHIPQQVFWKDVDSVFVGANAAFLATFGMSSIAELRGKSDFDLSPPEHARKYRKDEHNVIRHNRPRINYEEQMVATDGEMHWLETSKVPLHDQSGKVVGVLGMFEDITRRKAMQQELADTLTQLRTILDNAQVGIVYLREGRFVWINRRLEEMFGYKLKDIREKSPELFFPGAEDYALVREQSFAVLSQGKPFEVERPMKRKNGRAFWCHMRGMAVDTRNMAKGSIWTLMDIDRRKAAEQKLLELNNTLAQQVRREIANGMERERLLIQQARHAAMGEMIGNIAHQWRQPLSVLGLILQNIAIDHEDNELTGDALKRYVADALRAIQQMSGTIDDFRNFFQPSRHKVVFNLRRAVDETLTLLSASLKDNNIVVKVSGPEDIEIFGHQNEFSQMLLNLIGNAKDALEESREEQPAIDIDTARDGAHATITVRDNAGGVPADIAEKIFDPYFTTKEHGTGIGLYMTKTILEKHMHGAIAFRNGDLGAEFTLRLPHGNASDEAGASPEQGAGEPNA